MIDLHAHILPSIDDGPRTEAESVAMARAVVADGTHTIASTPHLRWDHPRVRVEELAGRLSALEDRLADERVPLRLVHGGEVALSWAQAASDEQLGLASLGHRSDTILLETPDGPLSSLFEPALFELSARGVRVLLAHPERSPTFQRRPERLERLVEGGILVQVTAGALAHPSRRSYTRRLALLMVRHEMAHVIASDSHGPRMPGRAGLSAGVAAAAELVGEAAEWMVTTAPAAILAGEPLPPRPTRRRSGFLGSRRRG